MTEQLLIPASNIPELVKHLNEVLNAIQDVNNGLVARLTALPGFPDDALAILNQWSMTINDVHIASDAFIMELHGTRSGTVQ